MSFRELPGNKLQSGTPQELPGQKQLEFYDTDPEDLSVVQWYNTTENKLKVRLPSEDIYEVEMTIVAPPVVTEFEFTFCWASDPAATGWYQLPKGCDQTYINYSNTSNYALASTTYEDIFYGISGARLCDGGDITKVEIGINCCTNQNNVDITIFPTFSGVEGGSYGPEGVRDGYSAEGEWVWIDITAEKVSWAWPDFDVMSFRLSAENNGSGGAAFYTWGARLRVSSIGAPTIPTETVTEYWFDGRTLYTPTPPAIAWEDDANMIDATLGTWAVYKYDGATPDLSTEIDADRVAALSPTIVDVIKKVEIGVRTYSAIDSDSKYAQIKPSYDAIVGYNYADWIKDMNEAEIDYNNPTPDTLWIDITGDPLRPNLFHTLSDLETNFKITLQFDAPYQPLWLNLDDVKLRVTTVPDRS